MSIKLMKSGDKEIIVIDFEDIKGFVEQEKYIYEINRFINGFAKKISLIVDFRAFETTPGILDLIIRTARDRANLLNKVALIGINKNNEKVIKLGMKFQNGLITRKICESMDEA